MSLGLRTWLRSRDPWLDVEPRLVVVGDKREASASIKRPWPNQAHLTPVYVEELRQFVERGAPEHRTEGGVMRGSSVILNIPSVRSVHPLEFVLPLIGVLVHGPELQDLEGLPVAADARLL